MDKASVYCSIKPMKKIVIVHLISHDGQFKCGTFTVNRFIIKFNPIFVALMYQ